MNTRSKLIRLAYENPEMRDDLLPLIQKEASPKEYIIWGVPKGESREQVLYTKARSMGEAKKLIGLFKSEQFGATKLRVQVFDPNPTEKQMNNLFRDKKLLNLASLFKKEAGAVAKTILEQMGGQRKLMMFIGARNFDLTLWTYWP